MARIRHRNDAWSDFRKPLAIGTRYGDLTVTEILGRKPRSKSTCVYVYCTCQCGGHWGPGWRIVRADNLRSGATTSCGCFRSHKQGDLRSLRPEAPARGRYRTYVFDGKEVLTGQAALAKLPWPGRGGQGAVVWA